MRAQEESHNVRCEENRKIDQDCSQSDVRKNDAPGLCSICIFDKVSSSKSACKEKGAANKNGAKSTGVRKVSCQKRSRHDSRENDPAR